MQKDSQPLLTTPDFPSLKFKHPWRPEQARILNNLDRYLADKRVHIVAAPGAGKTVLGLECFKHLKQKALVISPTMVVRDQWMERLADFLPPNESYTEWCSQSLLSPNLFTTTTYQGLYSFDKRLSQQAPSADDKKVVEGLQYDGLKDWFIQQGITVLILDEAHHLKAAWWEVLMKLVNTSDELIVISLTGTPPYDANATEWERYMELCGAVDEEISIPELVRSHSLCPHQDYIWMVKTDARNVTSLSSQEAKLEHFIHSLATNRELMSQIQCHHWLEPDSAVDVSTILTNLDECFALLGLLKAQQQALPVGLLVMLERTPDDIRPLDTFDWQVLLQSVVDGEHYPNDEAMTAFRESFSRFLRGKHYLKQRRVVLDNSDLKLKALSKTQERIIGCFEIAQVEYKNRQEWMRLVVLTDFIRDEKFQLALSGLEASTGSYPIFHYFIHHLPSELATKTALLTGRLSILPRHLLSELAALLPDGQVLESSDYSEHDDYCVLHTGSEYLSAAMTALHKAGQLQILIGTRGLLGEGWDAPHVNALVLASQTGAYVTTNQLRGRAIRIDPEDDLKTASIWHLIAVAPDARYNHLIFQDLNRRFKTFAGIHASDLRIESGIERLAFDDFESSDEDGDTAASEARKNFIEHSNQLTTKRLEDDIFNLQARWQNALEKTTQQRFQLGLNVGMSTNKRWTYLAHNYSEKNKGLLRSLPLLSSVTTGLTVASLYATQALSASQFVSGSLIVMSGVSAALLLRRIGEKVHHHVWGAQRLKETMHLFAQVVLASLRKTEHIRSVPPAEANEVTVYESINGQFRFSLHHVTRQENDLFLNCLGQLLSPIRQPRYVLVTAKQSKAADIVPVPHLLGQNKKSAMVFADQWNQHFPDAALPAVLHWTNSDEGRRYLLKARVASHDEREASDLRLIDRWE